MKRRLEHAYHGHIRQNGFELPYRLYVGGVMHRRDVEVFAHVLHDLVRQLVYAVVASGKHGLEAYGAYFLHALYHARFVAGQLSRNNAMPSA